MTSKEPTIFSAVIHGHDPVSLESQHTSGEGIHFGLVPHAVVAGFPGAVRRIEKPKRLWGVVEAEKPLKAEILDGNFVEPGAERSEQLDYVCPRGLRLLGDCEILASAAKAEPIAQQIPSGLLEPCQPWLSD